jgi:hypothetical protein
VPWEDIEVWRRIKESASSENVCRLRIDELPIPYSVTCFQPHPNFLPKKEKEQAKHLIMSRADFDLLV